MNLRIATPEQVERARMPGDGENDVAGWVQQSRSPAHGERTEHQIRKSLIEGGSPA